MRICRKCGDKIPNKIYIDNKSRNLQNRKFCLKCSPYNGRNTSSFDPIKRRSASPYSTWTNERKESQKISLYLRALRRKQKLIDNFGGKCQICGYNKSWKALSFHHLNPSEKKFQLCLNILWSKSWEEILKEAEGCRLLCLNCHVELGQESKFNTIDKINKKYGTNF